MEKLSYLLIICTVLVSISCRDEENTSSITSCCALPAIEAEVGDGNIFIPNIFTPDNDGINDLILVFASPSIALIKKIEIRNAAGNLVFELSDVQPNNPSGSWDGVYNGQITKGLYSIKVEAEANNGMVKTVEGEICCLPCEGNPIEPTFEAIDNCIFGTQHNGLGNADTNLPSLETLPCLN